MAIVAMTLHGQDARVTSPAMAIIKSVIVPRT